MLKKIGDVEVRPTRMTLQLVDMSIKHPYGIVEDLIVKVDKFLFPVDFWSWIWRRILKSP